MSNRDPRFIPLVAGLVVGSALSIGFFFGEAPATYSAAFPYCTEHQTPPAVLAHAGYAYDLATGAVLFDKQADAQLPLASLTKIMTVLTATGALSPTTTVTITRDALTPDGESGFKVGEVWQLKDLADFTLVTSSNDGARALMLATIAALHMSEDDFYAAMNRRARSLDLSGMFFINETGLDVSSSTAGAYGSARDVAHLIGAATTLAPDIIESSTLARGSIRSDSGILHLMVNTSPVAALLLGATASKTGYTDLAGGNLAVVFEPIPGHPIAVAVLGSTRDGRNDDVRALSTYVTDTLKRQLLCGSL